MKLTFLQGIARYQTDVYATATFLQKSSQSGEFIDLIVSPDPTIVIFAHRGAAYIVEESRTVIHAWGPIPTGQGATRYLYWDISLLDASLTRGFTNYAPETNAVAPSSPATDQHWFDTTLNQVKVWNGNKWVDKLRVFAAVYSSQAIIQPYPLGSQVGLTGNFKAGNLVLDSFEKPLRQSDGTFITSASGLSIINSATTQFEIGGEVVSGMANEYIPKFHFVQERPNRRIILARSDDWKSRILGLVIEDLYESEVGLVKTNGLVRNEQWSFPNAIMGRPIFCGVTGEITTVPPTTGVNQIAGYIYDKDSIHLNIQAVTILDAIQPDAPVQPAPPLPIANFIAIPLVGTAPMTVEFTSTSLHNPTSFEWDFKNDGTIDASGPTAAYTFGQGGTYSVRLKVANINGIHEIIKTNIITVAEAFPTSVNTNLGIQLGGPLQVASGQTFQVTITISNDGYRTASEVMRSVVIDDMGNTPISVVMMPSGALVTDVSNTTVLTFPVIANLTRGQFSTSTFSIAAPAGIGTIKLRATVYSPQPDSTLSDNVTNLSIKVK